jgi:hypothetical protein
VTLNPTRTVSWFPVDAGRLMWNGDKYSSAVVRRDFLLAKSLGFDTVRVFLIISAFNATDAAGSFNIGGTGPTASQLARLTDLCSIAQQVGVQIHLNLFDGFGQFGDRSQSAQWLTAVAGAIPDKTVIRRVEPLNEIKLSLTARYDGGGTSPVAPYTTLLAGVSAGAASISISQAPSVGRRIYVGTDLVTVTSVTGTGPYTVGITALPTAHVGDNTAGSGLGDVVRSNIGANAQAWANAIIPQVKTAFPGVEVVLSCTNDPSTDLAAGVANVTGVDRWSWHCYDPNATLRRSSRPCRSPAPA